jgi:hypothetical protein
MKTYKLNPNLTNRDELLTDLRAAGHDAVAVECGHLRTTASRPVIVALGWPWAVI